MRATKKGSDRAAPRSPLYTSRVSELAKRTALEDLGKDTDGAFRVGRRRHFGNPSVSTFWRCACGYMTGAHRRHCDKCGEPRK